MKNIDRKYTECILDEKCLARNVVYFSFLIPLHHQIVYDFAIGCATGQSCFVAIEKKCNCLVWASIPFDTLLSSYCLFEILIDKSKGGTFTACQNVIDQLFRTVRICNNFTINRLPYVVESCPGIVRKIGYVSTLKKLFRVNSFCTLKSSDIRKLKSLEADKLKEAIIINDRSLPRWAESIFNCKNVRQKCINKPKLMNDLIETQPAELTYAQRSTVANELMTYHATHSNDFTDKNIFTSTVLEDANQVLIQVRTSQELGISNRNSIKSWRKASLISAGKIELQANLEALIESQNLEEPVKNLPLVSDKIENDYDDAINKESAELTFQSPTININEDITHIYSNVDANGPNANSNKAKSGLTSDAKAGHSEMSYFTPTISIQGEIKGMESESEIESPIMISDLPKRKVETILKVTDPETPNQANVKVMHIEDVYREPDMKNKTATECLMNIASSLHQCGLIKGHRVTAKPESKYTYSKMSERKFTDESKIYSYHETEILKQPSSTASIKDASLSNYSNVCSSTTNTERIMSPQLVTSMENIEIRDQMWTPVPLSEHEIPTNTNNVFKSCNYKINRKMKDWERRLDFTMKQYMNDQIF